MNVIERALPARIWLIISGRKKEKLNASTFASIPAALASTIILIKPNNRLNIFEHAIMMTAIEAAFPSVFDFSNSRSLIINTI